MQYQLWENRSAPPYQKNVVKLTSQFVTCVRCAMFHHKCARVSRFNVLHQIWSRVSVQHFIQTLPLSRSRAHFLPSDIYCVAAPLYRSLLPWRGVAHLNDCWPNNNIIWMRRWHIVLVSVYLSCVRDTRPEIIFDRQFAKHPSTSNHFCALTMNTKKYPLRVANHHHYTRIKWSSVTERVIMNEHVMNGVQRARAHTHTHTQVSLSCVNTWRWIICTLSTSSSDHR